MPEPGREPKNKSPGRSQRPKAAMVMPRSPKSPVSSSPSVSEPEGASPECTRPIRAKGSIQADLAGKPFRRAAAGRAILRYPSRLRPLPPGAVAGTGANPLPGPVPAPGIPPYHRAFHGHSTGRFGPAFRPVHAFRRRTPGMRISGHPVRRLRTVRQNGSPAFPIPCGVEPPDACIMPVEEGVPVPARASSSRSQAGESRYN